MNFPQWCHSTDFACFRAEIIDESGHNMLTKDGLDYICWWTPEGVMESDQSFIDAGLLAIGSSASGDWLVIDTLADDALTIGFVPHERVWGERTSPREALTTWPDTLLHFLDQMWLEPSYVDC